MLFVFLHSRDMPKISERTVRALRREVAQSSRLVAETHQNVIRCLAKASVGHTSSVSLLKKKEAANRQLRQNISYFQKLFGRQQRIIREQQARLQQLQQVCNMRENKKKELVRETNEVAVAMIAMSQQCCPACLGSGSVFKTKKNIRYSVECKQCR